MEDVRIRMRTNYDLLTCVAHRLEIEEFEMVGLVVENQCPLLVIK